MIEIYFTLLLLDFVNLAKHMCSYLTKDQISGSLLKKVTLKRRKIIIFLINSSKPVPRYITAKVNIHMIALIKHTAI